MDAKNARVLPARLENVRRQFEQWRRTRESPSRIPEPLWAAAARMAGAYGVSRVAGLLRVNYQVLKKRAGEGADRGRPAVPRGSSLRAGAPLRGAPTASAGARRGSWNWPPSSRPTVARAALEVENARGERMHVRLRHIAMSELAAFCRSFWNPAS